MRNNLPDTKVSEEGGVGGAPGTRVEVPLQPMEESTVKQAFPAVHGEDHTRADTHTVAREGSHAGAGEKREEEGAAERSCYRLTAIPIPHPPCVTRWRGLRRVRTSMKK